jgi:hypothetical protein
VTHATEIRSRCRRLPGSASPWRAVVAALLAVVMLVAAAAPVWAAPLVAEAAPAAAAAGPPLDGQHGDADRDCIGFHGAHCHHHADRGDTFSPPLPQSAERAAYPVGERRLLSRAASPPAEPPRG